MVITDGSAGLHVVHILNKLGLSNRAQIGAWVAQHGVVDTSSTKTAPD
jgi:DNA-binding NarL/FixJ family response regulator